MSRSVLGGVFQWLRMLPVRYTWRQRGERFARWANRTTKLIGKGDVTFRFNPSTKLYEAHDPEFGVQCFAHTRRFKIYMNGLSRRGAWMGRDYILHRIDFNDGDHIVEVGANVGDVSLYFETLGIPVHITAFEPSPKEYDALTKNLAARKMVLSAEAHQLALWNEECTRTFFVKSDTADSSLVPISGAEGTLEVQCRRLDSVINEKRYRLLKLEAEGAEPEILEGAVGVIRCFDYVAADVGWERGVKGDSTLPEVANFLLQHGFEIVAIKPGRMVLLFRNKKP